MAYILRAEDAFSESQKKICLRPEHFGKKQNACPSTFLGLKCAKREALSVSISLRSMKAVRRLGETILRSPSNVADTAVESLWIPR
jgi:hypothetical protein